MGTVIWRSAARALVGASLVLLGGCSEHHPSAAAAAAPPLSPPPPATPALHLPDVPGLDILVVSFDALRADMLGVYGSEEGLSPAIDRFAASSVVFEHAFTAAPVTPTSFAASFTGRLPHRVFRSWQFAAPITLAETFRAHGYQTAAFLNNVQLTDERGFGVGYDSFEVGRGGPHSDQELLEHFLRWLSEERSPGTPAFAWLHFINPHAPYDRRPVGEDLLDPDYDGPFKDTSGSEFAPDNPRDVLRLKRLYEGEVRYIDGLFGTLIGRLDELGRLSTTLVVLTSDHGEEFGERGDFQHKNVKDETMHVPLILHHPGVQGGRRVGSLVSLLDLAPTLAGLAAVDAGDLTWDGADLRTGGGGSDRFVMCEAMTDKLYRALAVRTTAYKMIRQCAPEKGFELYDLAADPGETRNLAASSWDRVVAMDRHLKDVLGPDPCLELQRAVAGASPTAGLSERSLSALEALGYVER